MPGRLSCLAGVLAAVFWVAVAAAHDYRIGDLEIGHPYTQATPPGARNAAAYAKLTNTGTADVRLVGASTGAAERAEIHESSVENGIARMRRLEDGIVIPAGETVELAPRSYHVMLFGLKEPFAEGDRIRLVLSFAEAGDIEVELAVHALSPAGHAHH